MSSAPRSSSGRARRPTVCGESRPPRRRVIDASQKAPSGSASSAPARKPPRSASWAASVQQHPARSSPGVPGYAACAPIEVSAACDTGKLAAHDAERGGFLAGALLADPEGAFWLAAITRRRGGRLSPLTVGLRARPDLDRVAELIALPEP